MLGCYTIGYSIQKYTRDLTHLHYHHKKTNFLGKKLFVLRLDRCILANLFSAQIMLSMTAINRIGRNVYYLLILNLNQHIVHIFFFLIFVIKNRRSKKKTTRIQY